MFNLAKAYLFFEKLSFNDVSGWKNASVKKSSISVDIEIPGVLNDTPRNCFVLCLSFVGKLRYQFANLDNAHTTSVLKEIVLLKSRKVMMAAL